MSVISIPKRLYVLYVSHAYVYRKKVSFACTVIVPVLLRREQIELQPGLYENPVPGIPEPRQVMKVEVLPKVDK